MQRETQESFSEKLQNMQSMDDSNVYISHLPPELDEAVSHSLFSLCKLCPTRSWLIQKIIQALLKTISLCGHAVSCRFLRNPSGSSKGVVFARMATRAQAAALIERLNGRSVPEFPDHIIQARFADNQMQKELKKKQQLKKMRQVPLD
jgi:hypothetical protein